MARIEIHYPRPPLAGAWYKMKHTYGAHTKYHFGVKILNTRDTFTAMEYNRRQMEGQSCEDLYELVAACNWTPRQVITPLDPIRRINFSGLENLDFMCKSCVNVRFEFQETPTCPPTFDYYHSRESDYKWFRYKAPSTGKKFHAACPTLKGTFIPLCRIETYSNTENSIWLLDPKLEYFGYYPEGFAAELGEKCKRCLTQIESEQGERKREMGYHDESSYPDYSDDRGFTDRPKLRRSNSLPSQSAKRRAEFHRQEAERAEEEAALIEEVRLRELARWESLYDRFGDNDEWVQGSIITWQRNFGNRSKTYNYAATKVFKDRKRAWYITGREVSAVTFKELVEGHLEHADAEGCEIWYVTAMEEM